MKVLLLCGGAGIRLKGFSEYKPKAVIPIGHQPIIWHIMKRYSLFGFSDFVLALGSGGESIRDYFLHYKERMNDISINIGQSTFHELTHIQEEGWSVLCADTGNESLSGARIARLKQYLTEDIFMVHYSDILSDVDIDRLLAFHKKHGKIATITGVIPPYRINELEVSKGLARMYYDPGKHAPGSSTRYINGGHMVFSSKIFSYLNQFNECSLETDVFQSLMRDSELAVFPHHGFWRWLDTDRDYTALSELSDTNNTYWLMKGENHE